MKILMTTVTAGVLLASATCVFGDLKIHKVAYPVGAEQTISTEATVESINKDKREVTLKQADGSKTTIKVPEAVRNLDQVKVGDKLKVKYSEAIALGIRKS